MTRRYNSLARCHVTVARVIQMIDENKEQLRNLFRKYSVVDVQPAVTDKLPDDITTLQVQESRKLTAANMLTVWVYFFGGGGFNIVCARVFPAGDHHPGCAAVLGWNLFCHDELALPQSVRIFRATQRKCSVPVGLPAQAQASRTCLPPGEACCFCASLSADTRGS